MEKQIYKCKCGICGKEFDYTSEFLASDLIRANDGSEVILNNQCGANHSREERQAWWQRYSGLTVRSR